MNTICIYFPNHFFLQYYVINSSGITRLTEIKETISIFLSLYVSFYP